MVQQTVLSRLSQPFSSWLLAAWSAALLGRLAPVKLTTTKRKYHNVVRQRNRSESKVTAGTHLHQVVCCRTDLLIQEGCLITEQAITKKSRAAKSATHSEKTGPPTCSPISTSHAGTKRCRQTLKSFPTLMPVKAAGIKHQNRLPTCSLRLPPQARDGSTSTSTKFACGTPNAPTQKSTTTLTKSA